MTFPLTRRSVNAALLAAASATGVSAQTPDVGANLDRYMRRMETFGWGGQVLAARSGEVVLDEAYGWADRRGRRRMRATTPIGIASASKQFTAAGIMKLAEAGALSLDAPIGTYLPEAPPDKASLTLHQILSHTAGLAVGDLAEDFEALSREDMLARVYASPLVGAPSEEWRYSNAGYNLAAAIIEAASGRPYEDFLVSALFEPAGLSNTGFAFHPSLRPGPANAYRGWVDQGGPADWPRKNWRPWGGGTVFSTARDLYRWQQALEGTRVLSAASVARLIEPAARSAPAGPLDYAYGAFITRENDTFLIERSGDWERGYNAAWHRWPDEDLTLIIVSSGVTPSNVSMRQCVQSELEPLLRSQTLEQEPAEGEPLSRAARRRLEGEYAAIDGSRVLVVDDGAYLWIAAQSQPAVELLLPGAPPERRDAYRTATAKTQRLLSAPSRDGYAEALTPERPDLVDVFWNDWSTLVAQHGELQRYAVLGTIRAGRGGRTVARLTFARADIVMQFLWADFGAGRLVGAGLSDIAPAPFGCVLAQSGEGMIGYDTLSGSRFPVTRPSPRTLRIGETTLERA
jgi:CubicO group peptidase (beta-lactamase class C family)